MGCFSIPRNKSKVASHQADQNYGSKLEHMLSSNKPVLLPDPDYLAGEQSPGPGPLPASPSLRGFAGSGKKRGTPIINLSTGNNNSTPSRLTKHHPRALSDTVNYPVLGDDPVAGPFSAPLPSRPPLDAESGPYAVSTSNHGSPLCCRGVRVSEVKRSGALGKKLAQSASFNDGRTAFAARPLRLPKPQANGHPLPHPQEVDNAAAAIGPDYISPSPNRGKDALRAVAMGPRILEALPLPPPALPTESRIPVRAFPYSELAHSLVRECFIGDGVFGSAYRTWVDELVDRECKKKIEVAVVCPVAKALKGLKEWMAEVNWLARLQDPHLCKLIGYCAEDIPGLGSKRLLVYEFMCNGSLDKYVKGMDSSRSLDWSTRMRIALDIAQGLAYLHDKAPFQVICRDFSSPSIQLEKDLRAKLSGFGLARCGPEGDQGPPMVGPYVAPESGSNGLVTIKSNAWSFGVMLLELLTGRRHMDPSSPTGHQNLVQLTKPFLRDDGKLFLIMDPELNGRYSGRGALKVANLAFQCLIKEASLRPNLSEAVDVLKTVQIDEEAMASDFKKSRSLTQGIGSPLNFSRSTSDPFLHRGDHRLAVNSLADSVTSSPSNDLKRVDREIGKFTNLGSATSSPSFLESRLSSDLRQPKSLFSDREPQKLLPTFLQPLESRQNLEINQRKEGESQKLVIGHSIEVAAAPLQPSDSRQRGGRKLSTGVLVHDVNGAIQQVQEPQKLQTVQTTVKLRSLEVQKLPTALSSSFLCPIGEIKLDDDKITDSQNGALKKHHHPDVLQPYKINMQQAIDVAEQARDVQKQGQLSPAIESSIMQDDELKHQESQTSLSGRSSASSRASCAPALTFEPPMLREAF